MQLANIFDVKIHWDLYIYTFFPKLRNVPGNFIQIKLIDSKFYTAYPVVTSLK